MSVIDEKWKIVEDEVARHGWDKPPESKSESELSKFSFGDSVTANGQDGILIALTPSNGTIAFNAQSESQQDTFTYYIQTYEIDKIELAS